MQAMPRLRTVVYFATSAAIAAAAATIAAAGVRAQWQRPTFTGRTDLVRLDVVVLEEERRPVTDLQPAATIVTAAPQTPTLEAILDAAGRYLAQFAQDADGVVMQEDYLQQAQVQAVTAKQLRSDLAILGDPALGWIEFRDTTEVDGKAVEGRQARIVDLFSHPSADTREQARRIIAEGARFNLAAVGFQLDRTINLPMVALRFLQTANQGRSTFTREGFEGFGGGRTAIVRFREQAEPRLIGSVDRAAAAGTFLIDPASGRVKQSRLVFESARGATVVTATIRVDYGEASALHLWLPRTMEEDYRIANGAANRMVGVISGRASYSHYRKFNVAVEAHPAE
jgi:hypothetical protein